MGLLRLDRVRGIVDSNVGDITAFSVASNDGITYVQGDSLALVSQTTATQNGLFTCGAVTAGKCNLIRSVGWESGVTFTSGTIFTAGHEGTNYKHTTWRATVSGTVGTNDPVFYPNTMLFPGLVIGSVAGGNVAGTYTIGAGGGSEKLWLFSTTTCAIKYIKTAFAGTGGSGFAAPAANRIAGKTGTAAIQIVSQSTTATQTLDTGTLDVAVVNFG